MQVQGHLALVLPMCMHGVFLAYVVSVHDSLPVKATTKQRYR